MCQSYINLHNQFIHNNYQIIILIKSIRTDAVLCAWGRSDCRLQIPSGNLRVIFRPFRLFIRFTTHLPLVLCVSPRLAGIFRRRDSYFIPRFFAAPSTNRRKMNSAAPEKMSWGGGSEGDGKPLNILSLDKKSCERDATFICQ